MSSFSDWEQCDSLDCDGEGDEDEEEEGGEGDEPDEPADPSGDPEWLKNLRRRLARWEDLIDLAKEWAEARAAEHCELEDLGTTQPGQLIILPGIDGGVVGRAIGWDHPAMPGLHRRSVRHGCWRPDGHRRRPDGARRDQLWVDTGPVHTYGPDEVIGIVVRVRFPDFLYAGRITYTVTAA